MRRSPYRHLLVPTDGSPLAGRGVKAAMALARALGARVRGLYVVPSDTALIGETAGVHGAPVLLEHFEGQARAAAKDALDALHAAARKAGVRCTVQMVQGRRPWEAILDVAQRRRCDLVVIASRRRSALGGLLFGSETARLLSRAEIAVLVVR